MPMSADCADGPRAGPPGLAMEDGGDSKEPPSANYDHFSSSVAVLAPLNPTHRRSLARSNASIHWGKWLAANPLVRVLKMRSVYYCDPSHLPTKRESLHLSLAVAAVLASITGVAFVQATSIVVRDTFTAADGTLLLAHIPDKFEAGAWSQLGDRAWPNSSPPQRRQHVSFV